jgi:2-polyprenyl-6-methoxyphenol hydroxylase-like FAD-dependent oxidoreductase
MPEPSIDSRSLPAGEEVAAMSRQIGDHAVVLGASMAGLLAARVLADAYAQVTVIDRDQLAEASTHRRGVPHGRHAHALLARGQQALEELFPGLTGDLIAQGVPTGDLLPTAAGMSAATGSGRRTSGWSPCPPAGRSWRTMSGPGCGRSLT